MGIIYKVTNKTNGKFYIGKTIQALKTRISKHKNDVKNGSQTFFHRALRIYGFDNFEWEIIEYNVDNKSYLSEREIIHIAELSATNRTIGYNITSGGDGGPVMYGEENPMWGKKRPEIAKIMSELRKGVPLKEEHKLKIKKQMQNYVGENNPAKRSESRKKISNNAVKVIVSINGVIYNGITDASKQLNINRSTVKQRLNSTSEKFKDWKKIGYLNAEENKRYN